MPLMSKSANAQQNDRIATVPSSFWRAVDMGSKSLRQLEVPLAAGAWQHACVRIHVVLCDEVPAIHHIVDVEIGAYSAEDAISTCLHQCIARQPDAPRQ